MFAKLSSAVIQHVPKLSFGKRKKKIEGFCYNISGLLIHLSNEP